MELVLNQPKMCQDSYDERERGRGRNHFADSSKYSKVFTMFRYVSIYKKT